MSESYCPRCSRPLTPGATHCVCGAEVKPAGGGGKWLLFGAIGCGCVLVGAAVAGIVAALVIPNFLDAQHKAKQKRTLDDLRAFGAALESYRSDQGRYPAALSAQTLRSELAAHGLQEGTGDDGWKHQLRWSCLAPDAEGCHSYELASAGSDKVFAVEPGDYEEGAFAVTAYDEDIVLVDGLFTRWPEGQGRFGAGDG